MRDRRRLATALLATAIASSPLLAHCSFLTESDGLTGGGAGGGAGDAQPAGDAEARVDAGGEGDEVPPPRDGSLSDGPSVADTGPTGPGFCASLSVVPLFCDDFDGRELGASWDKVVASQANVALANDAALSPPRSMLVTTTTQGGLGLEAYVAKAFAPWTARPMTATLEADVRVETTHDGDVPIAAIQLLEAGGKLYEIQLRVTSSGAGGSVGTVFREHTRDGTADSVSDRGLAPSLAIGAWTHVRIEMTYRIVAPSSARIALDGVKLVDVAISPTTIGGTPRAALGITGVYGPIDRWAIRYDNAVFDAVP